MDAAAHDRTASRAGPTAPAVLLTLLLLLCASSAPVFAARDDTELSPGVSELLRGTPSSAIPLLEREAAAGDGRAAAHLAVARHYGWGTPIDEASALQLARQAEAAGYEPATLLRYLEFEPPSTERDLKKARSAAKPLASRGDGLAQFYFAMASTKRIGVGALVEGLLVAPLLGPDDDSARTPSQMREDPDYVSSTTTKYLRKSHAAGFAPASYLLGAFTLKNATDVSDVGETVALFHASANREFAPASAALALLIEQGLVTDPMLRRVGPAPWYERAADLGDPDAMHGLAMLYISGEGVPKDLERAQALLEQAVSLGRTDSAADLQAVRSALSDERSRARRLQEERDAAELRRRAWERAERARLDALAAAASQSTEDDQAPATADPAPPRPLAAAPVAVPRVTTARSVSQPIPDENPTFRQLYGASLPWLILKLLGLLLLAELLRRLLKLMALPASVGFAAGYADDLQGAAKVAAIGFAAIWVVSLPPVFYGLIALTLWSDHQSRIADARHARDAAKSRGELTLEAGEIADASGVTLRTDGWPGNGRVAIRVRNDSVRGDLALLGARCAFSLRNGEVAHTDELDFPLDPPLPSGFGTGTKARTAVKLQFDEADYQGVSCEITSALLRPPPTFPGVRIAEISHDDSCRASDSGSSGCLRITVENSDPRPIDDLEIRCIAGYRRDDLRWETFSHFRREFAKVDDALLPGNASAEIVTQASSAPWPEDAEPRCDIVDVEWR